MVARLVRFCNQGSQKAARDGDGRGRYLRCNEFEPSELPPRLFVDDVLDFGVDLCQLLVQNLVLKWHMCKLNCLLKGKRTAHVVGGGCGGHCSANEGRCETKRVVGEKRTKHPSTVSCLRRIFFLTEARNRPKRPESGPVEFRYLPLSVKQRPRPPRLVYYDRNDWS